MVLYNPKSKLYRSFLSKHGHHHKHGHHQEQQQHAMNDTFVEVVLQKILEMKGGSENTKSLVKWLRAKDSLLAQHAASLDVVIDRLSPAGNAAALCILLNTKMSTMTFRNRQYTLAHVSNICRTCDPAEIRLVQGEFVQVVVFGFELADGEGGKNPLQKGTRAGRRRMVALQQQHLFGSFLAMLQFPLLLLPLSLPQSLCLSSALRRSPSRTAFQPLSVLPSLQQPRAASVRRWSAAREGEQATVTRDVVDEKEAGKSRGRRARAPGAGGKRGFRDPKDRVRERRRAQASKPRPPPGTAVPPSPPPSPSDPSAEDPPASAAVDSERKIFEKYGVLKDEAEEARGRRQAVQRSEDKYLANIFRESREGGGGFKLDNYVPFPVQVAAEGTFFAGILAGIVALILGGVSVGVEAYAVATGTDLPANVKASIDEYIVPLLTPSLIATLGCSVCLGILKSLQEPEVYREKR
ncbi:unnamed protein product [Vitrella brassicaformis CCMP3155]|uniref:COP9 signalosome complex subunit 3 N-terminal helical repeats domain-containing protein n=2 Tax=Vitrella brassicaformis TaxID=1169539 RepID=A0A0G4ER45_VITBC|nr:unnamed protein product [Vitrella brassicaformis CCMP3155]|eukprot:CEL99730.1 unnamed protein product [Vitrella brassicaformis CCMP3155]